MTNENPPVTRYEFNSAIQRLENALNQQTVILQALAASTEANKARDEKLTNLLAKVITLRNRQDETDKKLAWYAGAGVVLAAAWPLVAKKIGFM